METYTACKSFVDAPDFKENRRYALDNLEVDSIDLPLVPLIQKINRLPYVFSLQCCHGHFLSKDSKEMNILESLEAETSVKYRLAYIAVCMENNFSGRRFQQKLMTIPRIINRDKVQFCSAQWFWDQWPNSYAIQVMPERFKTFDCARIRSAEARQIAKIRDACFSHIDELVTHILNQEEAQGRSTRHAGVRE